jgi:hypothetical protein
MDEVGRERSWEWDPFVIAAGAGRGLERRLVALGERRPRSPRRLAAAAALLGALVLPGMVPWQVSAEGEPSAGGAARLAQHWEDLLLLEAIRYLVLSQEQISQLLPVARKTDARLQQLKSDEERALTALAQVAGRARQALLTGRPPDPRDQEEDARLRAGLDQTRTKAANDIVAFATPYLARLLSRDQIAFAWRLMQGNPPAGVAVSPALLDPESGFVGAAASRRGAYESRRSGLVLAPAGGEALPWREQGLQAAREARVLDEEKARVLDEEKARADAAVREMYAYRLAQSYSDLALTEADAMKLFGSQSGGGAARAGDPHFMQRLAQGASMEELAAALEPLVRRLFLSPRFAPVLEEGLARGMGRVLAREAAPAGTPRLARDYRFHRGFTDLAGGGAEVKPLGGAMQNGYYVFGPGQGLRLADMGVSDHYAVEFLFHWPGGSGYQKLVDFKNRSGDGGLYVLDGNLTFYNVATGGKLQANRDTRIRLERNRATRMVRAFLDGQPVFAFLDLDAAAVFDKDLGWFFVDDQGTGGEQGPGAVAWLNIWDRPAVQD